MNIEQQVKVLEGHIKKVESELSTTKGQLKKLKEMVEKKDDDIVGKRIKITKEFNSLFEPFKGATGIWKGNSIIKFDNNFLEEINKEHSLLWYENEFELID